MNGGMGFHQKDYPRKPRATLEEVMLHAPDAVKACLRQRLLQYTHDPIAITQEGWGQPRHVGNQMPWPMTSPLASPGSDIRCFIPHFASSFPLQGSLNVTIETPCFARSVSD